MQKSLSIYLDAVRFLAAMTVLVSHLVYPRWTGGVFPENIMEFFRGSGDDAVAVFFVLSGFIIAFTAETKDRTWRRFAFSRATRILSVAAPAVVLTIMLDWFGRAMNPDAYVGYFFVEAPVWESLFRSLTFTNEFWFSPFRTGSNGPYWSLGYEVPYYAAFALLAFLRGWPRVIAFLACAILVGPPIVLLAPVWFAGVWLYHRLVAEKETGAPQPGELVVGGLFAFVPVIAYGVFRAASVKWTLFDITADIVGAGGMEALRYSRNLFWWWLMGILITSHFYGMHVMLRQAPAGLLDSAAPLIRWLAGASFSIYLVHYPVMQFLDAVLIGDEASMVRMLILLGGCLAACFVFAEVFERRLKAFRMAIASVWRHARPVTAV